MEAIKLGSTAVGLKTKRGIILAVEKRITSPLLWNALYAENMLRVERNVVGEIIGSRILMAVVDRLIKIDVEIKWEHILHEDSSKVYIFDMEMEDDEENEEPGKPGSEENVELPKSSSMQSLGGVVDKMDVLMEITLEHLKLCANEGRLSQVYDTLMHSFQSTILNTHKSKLTQSLSLKMRTSSIWKALVLALAVQAAAMGGAEAEMSCSTVIFDLLPCLSYVNGGDANPTAACCDAVKNLSEAATTTPDRQAVCKCIKSAAGSYTYDSGRADKIPQLCGVNAGVPISGSTNCDEIP